MAYVLPAGDDAELARSVMDAGGRGLLARGLGRSYGDAAQNAGGTVLDMTQRNRILSVDADTGLVRVESGVSLDALMRTLLPKGLFVPVSPGTRQVTVGGAIAADVHGKNHHLDGSFGRHVVSMTLLLADGTVREVGPLDPVFWATVGGMGLTGVILSATVRLKRVETAYCVVDTERIPDLDELLRRMSEEDHRYTYSVAWVDTLARGRSLGRSVLTRGWSARRDQLSERQGRRPLDFHPRQRLVAPPVFPGGLLNKVSVGAFNKAWYFKTPGERRGEIQDVATFFHPLDGVGRWNRIYGPRGFVQFQMVVPLGAERALEQCLELVGSAGQGSFLAVVKRFGGAGPGHLSFPIPGWTLALDLPAGPSGLVGLLDRLDTVVLSAGGREYLAKDSRLPATLLPAMYPRLDEWREVRESVDPGRMWSSDLSRRLGL
ncbi:MAG: FAD-binding oxidoreductase [Actinomycetota bacterium]|nr:FAD-binding oxidoreductase [Actinomycetota bacterium]